MIRVIMCYISAGNLVALIKEYCHLLNDVLTSQRGSKVSIVC